MRAVLRVAARAWARLDRGSEVQSITRTRLPNGAAMRPVHEKQTLKAREGERVTIRWELGAASREPTGEMRVVPGDDALAESVAVGTETVEVPAGKFECRHFRARYLEDGVVTTADLWVAADVPVPVQTEEVNARETTVTTLERCTLKQRAAK